MLSLGAGVQSSAMLLMAVKGFIPKPDYVIFSDTQYEPEWTYKYLDYLKSVCDLRIITVTAGSIKKDALDLKKHRFASMPLHVMGKDGKRSILRRQCTNEYKIRPIRKEIRRLVDNKINDYKIKLWIGITTDEASRMKPSQVNYIENVYPLIDLMFNRNDCKNWLKDNNYRVPPKSSCLCCPFHDNHYWRALKVVAPNEFEDTVRFDGAIRKLIKRFNVKEDAYLHPSLEPLEKVDLLEDQIEMFENECFGFCNT